MAKEKIFVSENKEKFYRLHEAVRDAFEQCEELEQLITGFGLPMTHEIVSDCLSLAKTTENRPKENCGTWVGMNDGQTQKEYEPVEVYTDKDHLDAEFSAMLKAIEDGQKRPNEKQAKAESLKAEYTEFLDSVYGLFHIKLLTIDTKPLLKYFDIKDGHVVLPEDLGEQMKADAAIYTETDGGVEAYKLHHKLADGLNILFDLMKNGDRLALSGEIQKLFAVDADGRVSAATFDYDLFCG